MQVELKGKIKSVLPAQSGQGKNGEWVKHSFVVEWQENGYTQLLFLEVVGAEKWEKMQKAVVVGHEVLCKFSVSSREYNQKYYTTCNCFYCATIGGVSEQTSQAPSAQQQQPEPPLPF